MLTSAAYGPPVEEALLARGLHHLRACHQSPEAAALCSGTPPQERTSAGWGRLSRRSAAHLVDILSRRLCAVPCAPALNRSTGCSNCRQGGGGWKHGSEALFRACELRLSTSRAPLLMSSAIAAAKTSIIIFGFTRTVRSLTRQLERSKSSRGLCRRCCDDARTSTRSSQVAKTVHPILWAHDMA